MPTRNQYTLELAVSNNPSSIDDVSVVLEAPDRDCSLIKLGLKPIRH